MSRIFWDTNLFVYLLRPTEPFTRMTRELRIRMLKRGDRLFTSAFTIGEILVKPTEAGDRDRCRLYETSVTSSATLIPLDVRAARAYAAIRSDRFIKPPDAIQLACAASVGMDLFITNDHRLQNQLVDGIQFIVPLDRVPI